jgi:hypothetical protein
MLKIKNKKLQGFLLVLLGIGISIFAQVKLLESRHGDLTTYYEIRRWVQNTWDNTSPIPGVSLYIVAGIFFLLGLRSFVDTLPTLRIDNSYHPQTAQKFGFWATSLGISIIIALYANQAKGDDRDGYLFTIAWAVSIILLIASVCMMTNWRLPSRSTIFSWIKIHRAELFVLAAILVVAFIIRFLDIELHPYSFINDEGQMGSGGACIVQGKCLNFFSLGWADQPRLAFFPYAISIALF